MPVRPWGQMQWGRDQWGDSYNHDDLALADSLATKLGKALSDVLTLSDEIALKLSIAPTDALGLLDTVVATRVLILQSGDPARQWGGRQWGRPQDAWGDAYSAGVLALADAMSIKMSKTMEETLTLLDALALTLKMSLTESLSLSDAVTLIFHLAASESATLLDAIALHSTKLFDEICSLAESVQPLLVSLPSVFLRYAPRPLVSLTVGATTKYYSTEDVYVA